MAGDLQLAGVQLVAQNAQVFFGDMNHASQAVNSFSSDTSRAASQTSGASQVMIGALRQVGAMAVDALAKAGQAVASFASDSISKAGDFQQGMLQFQAVAGKDIDTKGLEQFRAQFIQLGRDLPVSTADVQKAAIEMVKGGIDPAIVAAGGLKQNIQFAAAAMDGDLVGAAETSAKLLGGWADATATAQQKADFLTHSTDLLTKAANASSVDVKELSLGIFNAQGIAKAAGVSFDDLTTTLAELAPRFASSSEAGTSLKNLIARLQPTTKPAIAAMKGLGLITADGTNKFYDAEGRFIGFSKASQLLQDSLKGLTKQQQAAVLQTIFGNDAMGAASALAELGAQGYDTMAASLAKANGVAENAALKQQGYNTALENAKGSFEALQITVGSALLPILTDLLNNVIAPGINTVTTFADSIFSAADPLAALTASIDTVIPGFQTFVTWAGDTIPKVIDFFMQHIDALEGALIAIGAVIAGAAVAGAIASLANPITAIIVAVGLLGAAWNEDWGGIRTTLSDFWKETGEPIFTEVVTWLEETIPPAIDTLAKFWTTVLLPALTKVWAFISTYVIPIIVTLVTRTFVVLQAAITTLASYWTDTLWPALQKVWNFLNTYIIPLFEALANVTIALLEAAIKDLAAYWSEVLYPAIEKVYNWFNDNIVPIFNTVASNADSLADKLKTVLGPAFQWFNDNVLKPASEWLGTIGEKVQHLIDWLNDLADKIRNMPGLPSAYTGHSPPPMANWMGTIADETHRAAAAFATMARATSPAALVSPAASVASLLNSGRPSSTTYNQQRTVNMPIYTNQSPAVIRQSAAILQAVSL